MRFLNKNKVAVYGLGIDSVKATYILENGGVFVDHYILVNGKQTEFCGKQVHLSLEFDSDTMIVVGCQEKQYMDIKKVLEASRLIEFKDFIFYQWIYKKIVILHGNCHLDVVREYLLSSKEFDLKYCFYPNPPVFANSKGMIDQIVLDYVDLFIHEDIQTDNKYSYYLSDEYILGHINSNALCITIPNLFGYGAAIYPQYYWNKDNKPIDDGKDLNGVFPHGDKVIDRLLDDGKSDEEIIAFCKSNECFAEEEIVENFNTYMDKIKERNKSWDIDIYDFIVENIYNEQLFFDRGHPTNCVLEYISKKILETLGIMDDNIFCSILLDKHEEPVYPLVKKVLGLNFPDKVIRESKTAKGLSDEVDFEEYIKEYIWWKKKCNT